MAFNVILNSRSEYRRYCWDNSIKGKEYNPISNLEEGPMITQ